MAWAVPKYPREVVNRAGIVLLEESRKDSAPWSDIDRWTAWGHALEVVNNWRSAHGYALNTFAVNLRKASPHGALVAQRTKRLASITAKLDRLPNMKLTQMQDIGGCRAVVEQVGDVVKLAEYYQKTSRIKHALATCDDYIEHPQPSGYRGTHLVYRYFSDKRNTKIYNSLKIEIQIRSQYQHAWATAVETVGTFIQQALKSSIGEKDWLRFFALMGSAVALREGTPLVPNTPTDRESLRVELDHYSQLLQVATRLQAYNDALRYIEEDHSMQARYYLLQLDPKIPRLSVNTFGMQELEIAEKAYAEAEKYVKEHPGTDAVLVGVDSITALQRAYPNYFADTRMFLALHKQALSGHQRRIEFPKPGTAS
jgi:ppGpp synthetase/RelA/SpoT-type nucleotidyltranferase